MAGKHGGQAGGDTEHGAEMRVRKKPRMKHG